MSSSSPLDRLRIASPCSASWSDMPGDDRVRFCGQCQLHVYNIAALPRDEVENMIRQREGRLCMRIARRADGTVLTQDCPVGLRAARHKAVRLLAAAAAMISMLFFAAYGRTRQAGAAVAHQGGIMDMIATWRHVRRFPPAAHDEELMGDVACDPPDCGEY